MAKTRATKSPTAPPTLPPTNPLGAGSRLAFTLLPLLVFLFARQVTLPGVDRERLEQIHVSTDPYSIVALGIAPLMTAALLVEIVALIVPRWRHLRHGGTAGRGKLQRATNILTVALAVFQGYATAMHLQGNGFVPDAGILPTMFITTTLVGGVMLVKLIADFITSRGLANGYGVVLGAWCILDTVQTIWARRQVATLTDLVGILGRTAVFVAWTWFVVEKLRPVPTSAPTNPSANAKTAGESDGENPYAAPNESKRDGERGEAQEQPGLVDLPTPASGVLPYTMTKSLLMFPLVASSIPGMAALALRLQDEIVYGLVSISLLVSLTYVCAWMFHQPRRVAEVYQRLHTSKNDRAQCEGDAREALRHATLHALLSMVGFLVLGLATKKYAPDTANTGNIAITTAWVIDLMREFRIVTKHRDLVAVWPEHRPYALFAARKALNDAGIFVHVRDERQRRLLQFEAPYLPMELFVPQNDAPQATSILENILQAKPVGTEEPEAPVAQAAPRRPLERRILLFLGVLTFLAILLSLPKMTPDAPRAVRSTKLEFVLVDDDHSIVDNATDFALEEKNKIQIETEVLTDASGKTVSRKYARVEPTEGETVEVTRARLETWAKPVPLPEGDRFALGEDRHFYGIGSQNVRSGWRTYLLKNPAILTDADIERAQAMPDPNSPGLWLVRLEFTADGAKRFEEITGKNIRRRFAILLDGRVTSAPVIQSKIAGGIATITMGNGDPEQQQADAQNLEKALNGR